MASLYKNYIPTTKENEFIKLSISFNRDSTNWATSQPKDIGYEVCVVPVTIERNDSFQTERCVGFSGFNKNLLKVDRQSQKRLGEAIKICESEIEQYKNWFRAKGYDFKDE